LGSPSEKSAPPDGDASHEIHVAIRGVSLRFGSRKVLEGLDCAFPRGRVCVVMGGSGSGKSTMLRLIAGLVRPQSGTIEVEGTEITRLAERELASVRTRIGMLFQGGALLDSMSVFDNVALPLRERTKLDEATIAEEVHGHLESVGLEDVDELLPGELSGGMLKRAALARAIINDPAILLCDEPFSGLDPPNVARIEQLLAGLCRGLGLTVIMSSHHVPTSRRMAHQITLLLPDSVITGSPRELAASNDRRVEDFLGVHVGDAREPGRVVLG